MSKYRITSYQRAFTQGATLQIARITIVAAGQVTLTNDEGDEHTFNDPSDETMAEIAKLVEGQ